MIELGRVKFDYSGKEDSYKEVIRQFTLDKLLERINLESADILMNGKDKDIPGVKRVKFKLYDAGSRIPRKQETFVSAWMLIELAYHAILWSNDYRGKEIEFQEELYALVSVAQAYFEREESLLLEEIGGDHTSFFLYLWGFGGEQFKFEAPGITFLNLARELYIVFESSKTSKRTVDAEKIVYDEVGVDWKTLNSSLLIAWFASTQNSVIDDFVERFGWNDTPISKVDFLKVMDYYTTDYKEIRSSKLGRQFLYSKPFVRNQRNKTISVNSYLNLFTYEHSIFWIIRNYYYKQDDQYFTSVFGDYFEEYFKELLETYLKPNEFERISEEETKRADWKMDIEGFHFIVEQKSTLLGVLAKQQNASVNTIKNFGTNAIIKALRQLRNTEEEFGEGKKIKIVLLYEQYLKPEALEQIFQLDNCDVDNDTNYWLVNINEMEMLLQLCDNERGLFRLIIEEKIKRETEHSHDGKSISQLLSENGIVKNNYLKQEKFEMYHNIATENVRKVIGSE